MNLNKTLVTLASAAVLASVAVPAFAKTDSAKAERKSSMASTTASVSGDVTAKIACVGSAVNARETSIDAAVATFSQTQNTALTARATALKAAYQQTTLDAVKTSVKTAWSTFSSSMKSARSDLKSARESAWKQFKTATAACKAPSGTDDGSNASSDAAGS